jgi:invasion protein IalB
MAPLRVALSAFALLAGAAASSTAAQPPAVAEATTDGAPNPSTLADAASAWTVNTS